MAKHVNVAFLRGTAESLTDDILLMKICPPNPRGGRYENLVPVDVSGLPKTRLKGIVGKRMEMAGRIVNLPTEDGQPNVSTFKPFKNHFETTDNPEDVNRAEVIGLTPSGVIYNERKGNQRAFSNVLMLAGETFVWAVAFKHAARLLKQSCPRGSLLKVGGRLNYREYEDGDLGWRQVYEVVADSEQINVLKKAEVVDDLADIRALGEIEVDDDEAEATTQTAI